MRGAIFDMDGVIVDNHEFHFKAWMTFAEKYKFKLDQDIYRNNFNGKTNADLFKMIFGHVEEEEIKKLADEKEGLYQRLYLDQMKPLKGLINFLEYLKVRGIKVALGTSAPKSNVDFILDTLELRHFFEVIVDGGDVKRGKPDPQVYQICCRELELDSEDCVVFEDSLAGLEAGIRAGCMVVGVATSHEPCDLRVKTNLILHDFTEARALLKI